MGLNALFTYTVCLGLGFKWEQALAMVFICGIINILITVTRVRKMLIKSIPSFLQNAISVGIGLFIAYLGIKNADFVQYSVSEVNDGIATASSIVPSLSIFSNSAILLALIGLVITAILVAKKVKGGILIGIIATTLIGIPMGITNLSEFQNFSINLSPTFLKLDFAGLFTAEAGLIVVIMTIFTFSLSDIFDTIGTFIGTGLKSGIFKGNIDEDPKLGKALYADSFATSIGALLGTSNTTTYVESAAGIEAGGRTGLTAVFSAMLFLVSLVFAPIVSIIPTVATAPALIIVGVMMMEPVLKIDWEDLVIAIPAFFTIIFMPFSFSITTGIQVGFLFYIITAVATGKYKKIHPMIYVFTLLFMIDFIYKAVY